ncbi:MAG: hypothetical protein JXA30_02265 [Deltaproteobacteria bacterium]|nr:hypothetical protein [Deltaproteobacteria bacterium]
MAQVDKHIPMFCLLLALLVLGCGDKGGGNEQSDGAAGSVVAGDGSVAAGGDASGNSGTSASGQGGGAGTTAGTGGSVDSQEQTPPPENPRELGPPDGIHCESTYNPPAETCSAGSRCCLNNSGEEQGQLCIADGGKCPVCNDTTCGQLLCDGPEDCPAGQFCCYLRRSCGISEDCNPEDPSHNRFASWMNVACQTSCEGSDDSYKFDTLVVCKDDRDCPGPYKWGRCSGFDLEVLPRGIDVCYD